MIFFIALTFILIVGLVVFLFSFSDRIFLSPELSPIFVTRVLPDSFVKDEPFNVTLNVEVVGPVEGNVLVGDLVEGATILGNNPDALVENDLIAWVSLSPENQSLTYSVVSDRAVLSFNGKVGFSLSPETEQEVAINGDGSISVQTGNSQIASDSSGGGGGGGGGAPVVKNNTSSTENVSDISSLESLFVNTEQMSDGEKAIIYEKKGEGIFILILLGIIVLVLASSFASYYFYRKK